MPFNYLDPMTAMVRARTQQSGLDKKRLLYALLSGVAAPNRSGGFWGGLQAGLGGSLAGGMGYDSLAEQRAAREQQAMIDAEDRGLKRRLMESQIEANNRRYQPDPTTEAAMLPEGVVAAGVEGPLQPNQMRLPPGIPPSGAEAFIRSFSAAAGSRAGAPPKPAGSSIARETDFDKKINAIAVQNGISKAEAIAGYLAGKYGRPTKVGSTSVRSYGTKADTTSTFYRYSQPGLDPFEGLTREVLKK